MGGEVLRCSVPDDCRVCAEAEVKWLPLDKDVHMERQLRREGVQGRVVEVTLRQNRPAGSAIQ